MRGHRHPDARRQPRLPGKDPRNYVSVSGILHFLGVEAHRANDCEGRSPVARSARGIHIQMEFVGFGWSVKSENRLLKFHRLHRAH